MDKQPAGDILDEESSPPRALLHHSFTMDFLSYFALGLILFVVLTLAYGMIAIHDIPYHIAKKRNHPHQDAIHTGGWVSLFTLHAIWPFLWIWATAYHPEHGYKGRPTGHTDKESGPPEDRVAKLEARLAELEKTNSETRK